MATEVISQGPLFDGRAEIAMRKALTEAVEEVSRFGDLEVRTRLHGVLKHPTGYYESQIQVNRASPDINIINDGNVIYGPWLEGVGSRNQTTRFKGYATFRKATQLVKSAASLIATSIVARHIGEMN